MVEDWNNKRIFLRNGITNYSLSSDAHRKLQDVTQGTDEDGGTAVFLIFIIIIMLLIVTLYSCVKMLRYGAGRDVGPQNTSDIVRDTIIANLTTKQRRDILEAFFSDCSKAMTSADLTELKSQNSPFRQQVESGKKDARSKEAKESLNCSDNNTEVSLHAPTDQMSPTKTNNISLEHMKPDTPVTTASFESSEDVNIEDYNSPTERRQLFHLESNGDEECAGIFLANPSEKLSESAANQNNEAYDEGDKVVTYQNSSLQRDKNERDVSIDEEEPVCPICLCEYEEGDSIIESKHCCHSFHKDCIFQWLEKHEICPFCRKQMITLEEITEAATVIVDKQRVFNATAQLSVTRQPLSPIQR